MAAISATDPRLDANAEDLACLVQRADRLFVLTGAGCSTESGIPDYRDVDGEWKHRRPVQFTDFVGDEHVRQRYWARSMVGWRRVGGARPNLAHRALADLERSGRVHWVVTQNVDRLHQRAGSRRVTDLHGRIDRVVCLECGRLNERGVLQSRLVAENPDWADLDAVSAPDGDALLEDRDFRSFRVPGCEACGGMLKPDVVFFGEGVPKPRVTEAMERLTESDALLVVGSSLMVWSGYRFARLAAEAGIPVAALNLGRTRADDLLTVKVSGSCGETLQALAASL
jgi:NAD-dependent SIR2 family protein deacetylase